MSERPCVLVLLATHNASPWLAEQLRSIARQRDVCTQIVASDDASTDDTRALLAAELPGSSITLLPSLPQRMGNANRNFLRLIRDVHLDAGTEYVALSDHDDIWLPSKLSRAISELERTRADAYSSNVTAFWPDGRERLIVKSGPQRRYDYLFESAGPGCSFVFSRSSFLRLQAWVADQFDTLQDVKVHDWLIYAYARVHGWSWHIDSESHMRYRQHDRNEVGANTGWRSAWIRFQQVRDGKYRQDILRIAEAVSDDTCIRKWLCRLGCMDRLRLFIRAHDCRRLSSEALLLGILVMIMPKKTLPTDQIS